MSAWLLLRCDCCGRCVFLVSANYSFLIFQWAEVVGPLLRLRNNHGPVPLRPGTVRLSIAGYGVIKMYRLILFITSRTLDWLRVHLRLEVDTDMLTDTDDAEQVRATHGPTHDGATGVHPL
jgi:hypothetical protein